uniref:H15 domain-containing protein n=1 Tax=Lynx canadensis TaxID=61383 RepID=A0A667IK64_LYNCA
MVCEFEPRVGLCTDNTEPAGDSLSLSPSPSESETECPASPKVRQKPSISKVILGVVAHKGAHGHVTLTTLKKAVATAGYNMTQNAWRFKRAVKGLVDKGMLKQVTGKGALGSFRIGNKYASKVKGRSQSRPQSGQRQSGQRRSGQRRAGQRRPGQRRLQAGSQKGHKRLNKGVRRVARCRHN